MGGGTSKHEATPGSKHAASPASLTESDWVRQACVSADMQRTVKDPAGRTRRLSLKSWMTAHPKHNHRQRCVIAAQIYREQQRHDWRHFANMLSLVRKWHIKSEKKMGPETEEALEDWEKKARFLEQIISYKLPDNWGMSLDEICSALFEPTQHRIEQARDRANAINRAIADHESELQEYKVLNSMDCRDGDGQGGANVESGPRHDAVQFGAYTDAAKAAAAMTERTGRIGSMPEATSCDPDFEPTPEEVARFNAMAGQTPQAHATGAMISPQAPLPGAAEVDDSESAALRLAEPTTA